MKPAKMLLMHRERQMNMLSPENGASIHQMDIETGKTVAEWSFKKVRSCEIMLNFDQRCSRRYSSSRSVGDDPGCLSRTESTSQ